MEHPKAGRLLLYSLRVAGIESLSELGVKCKQYVDDLKIYWKIRNNKSGCSHFLFQELFSLGLGVPDILILVLATMFFIQRQTRRLAELQRDLSHFTLALITLSKP